MPAAIDVETRRLASTVELDLALLRLDIKEACKTFRGFVEVFWPTFEPSPFIPNWHIDVICEYLEAFQRREIKNLLINIPPRSAKSHLCSVLFQPWVWTRNPMRRFLCVSNSEKNANEFSYKSRSILNSDLYQTGFGDLFTLSNDKTSTEHYKNSVGGERYSLGIGAKITSIGADDLIVDDPHDTSEVLSEASLRFPIEKYRHTIDSRLNNPIDGGKLCVCQRVADNDFSAFFLDSVPCVEHLQIPMEYNRSLSVIKPEYGFDPRADGQSLTTDRFDADAIASFKRVQGERAYSAQYQQDPSPEGGGVLDFDKFLAWDAEEDGGFPPVEFVVQSYDLAYTNKSANDPSACVTGGVFYTEDDEGRVTGNIVILDSWRDWLSFPDLQKRVLKGYDKSVYLNRRPDLILIESKGPGLSLVQSIKQIGVPVESYNPGRADKMARANMCAPFIENEQVYVLLDENGEVPKWAEEMSHEFKRFGANSSVHDDLVDAFTQLIIYFRDHGYLTTTMSERTIREGEEAETLEFIREMTGQKGNPYG